MLTHFNMKTYKTQQFNIDRAKVKHHISTIRRLQSLLSEYNINEQPIRNILQKALFFLCYIADSNQHGSAQKILSRDETTQYIEIHNQLNDIGYMTVLLCELSTYWKIVIDIFQYIPKPSVWHRIKLCILKYHTHQLGTFISNF